IGEVAGIGQTPVNSGQQGVNLAMRQRASDARPAGGGTEVPGQEPQGGGNPPGNNPENPAPGQMPQAGAPVQGMQGPFGNRGQVPVQGMPGQVPVQGLPGQVPV